MSLVCWILYNIAQKVSQLQGYGQTGPYRQAAGYDVIIGVLFLRLALNVAEPFHVEGEAGLMHMFAFLYFSELAFH